METYLPILIAVVTGYLLGSVNFAVLVARRHGVDILKEGSGNPGATNVKRVIGKKAGNLVYALDALKGLLATGWPQVAALVIASSHAAAGSESAAPAISDATFVHMQLGGFFGALLGHCYSCFLGFKGGKGVAVSSGALVGAMPLNVLAAAPVWIVFFLVTRYVSIASIATAVALPLIAWFMPKQGNGPHFWFSIFVAVFIVYTHRSNIARLIRGEENRFAKKK